MAVSRDFVKGVVAVAADCEVVRTATEQHNRKAPTAEQIIAELDSLDSYDGFELDQAERPEGNSREITGVTDEGLRFSFILTVSYVEETMW